MTEEQVSYEVVRGVATITLSRPDALNALTRQMRGELLEAIQQATGDRDVRVVVLTGAGRAFCVGQDVAELSALYAEQGPALGKLVEQEYTPIAQALRQIPKPTVAFLNGAAVGGGLALALAADFRILQPKSMMTPVFVKVGLAPDSGVTFFLTRMVGFARGLSLTLRGQAITPQEAVSYGLAARVNATREEADAELADLLQELRDGPTVAYAHIRALFDTAAGSTLAETMRRETEVQATLATTVDHAEAIAAFAERRQPNFVGR